MKIALTGATGGIGHALAQKMMLGGHELAILERTPRPLDTSLNFENSTRTKISYFQCDLGSVEQIEQAAAAVISDFGELDWLLNVGGYIHTPPTPFERESASTLLKTFQINTVAPFLLTQKLLPIIKQGVINISSTAGIHGNSAVMSYSISKGALNTFTLALAQAISPRQALAVCPGPTNTPMRERLAGDAAKHQSPEIVANLLLKIMEGKQVFENGSLITVRDGAASVLKQP